MSIHHSPNSPTQNSNAGRGDPPRSITRVHHLPVRHAPKSDRESLIALGWEANEIPYMPPEMIAEILATDLRAPTLLYEPTWCDCGFAPAPITEYIKPEEEWRIGIEMADRECARLLVNVCFDPPIEEEEIEAYAEYFKISKRQAELEIRKARIED